MKHCSLCSTNNLASQGHHCLVCADVSDRAVRNERQHSKLTKMMRHVKNCKVQATGGCSTCKRIWTTLGTHAEQCKKPHCLVPYCMRIREKFAAFELKQKKQLEMKSDQEQRQRNMNDTLTFLAVHGDTRCGTSTALFLEDDSDN